MMGGRTFLHLGHNSSGAAAAAPISIIGGVRTVALAWMRPLYQYQSDRFSGHTVSTLPPITTRLCLVLLNPQRVHPDPAHMKASGNWRWWEINLSFSCLFCVSHICRSSIKTLHRPGNGKPARISQLLLGSNSITGFFSCRVVALRDNQAVEKKKKKSFEAILVKKQCLILPPYCSRSTLR